MAILDILEGWVPTDPSTQLKEGDIIKQTDRGTNNGLMAANDSDIMSTIRSMSDTQFINEVRNQTGAEIEILNRDVSVIKPGWEWNHIYEYKIVKASPIAPIAVALIINVLIVSGLLAYLFVSTHWAIESTKIKTPWGNVSIFGILFAVVIAIVLYAVVKSFLK